MLGSHFDLDREIARIASSREAKQSRMGTRERQTEHIRAYSEFARSLTDFVRAVGDDREPSRTDAEAAAGELTARDPNVAKSDQDKTATLLDLAAGSLGQIR